MMLTDSDCVVGKPYLTRITSEFRVIRQESLRMASCMYPCGKCDRTFPIRPGDCIVG